ncbi:MAG: hypothetical protein Q8R88_06990, partial [Desulfoprunum sp.]|nr:hypothetical protein [Desulfoprunum sp.]
MGQIGLGHGPTSLPGFLQESRVQIKPQYGFNAIFPQNGHARAGSTARIENESIRGGLKQIENAS